MSGARHWEQDKDSTLYVGNLDERCSDALVWELMLQAGPVVNVHLPKDRVTQTHQGYGFVEFASETDAEYAAKIMNQVRVWGKPIRVNKASADKRGAENAGLGGGAGVGAELFVGNLDSLVDEKTLYDTFSRFGQLVAAPKVARDDANLSKGYGFVSYADFESSDQAIEHMHGQYLMNKEITVQYAYKKDGKGERHGDAAERALAAQAKKHGVAVEIQALPTALVMPSGTPSGPAAAMNPHMNGMNGLNGMNGYPTPPPNGFGARPPQAPPAYAGYGGPAQPPPPAWGGVPPTPVGYGHLPTPTATGTISNGSGPPPPSRQFNQSPLHAPSNAGLPARPPPSIGGYGGPPNAPGMQSNFQGQAPPPGGYPGMPPHQPPGYYAPPGTYQQGQR